MSKDKKEKKSKTNDDNARGSGKRTQYGSEKIAEARYHNNRG